MKQKVHGIATVIAILHWLSSFFTDKLIFEYALWEVGTTGNGIKDVIKTILAIGTKAIWLFVLILLWNKLFSYIKKREFGVLRYALIYFVIEWILLILVWPGIWRMDEFGVLNASLQLMPHFWQNYLTSIWYVFSLMLFPFPSGVILVQCGIIALIVGYLLNLIEQKKIFKHGWMIYLCFTPFLLLPVLDSNLYPVRLGIYAFLELLMIGLLYFKQDDPQEKIPFGLLIIGALVTVIRAEAIYYVLVFPIVLILFFRTRNKKPEIIKWILIYVGFTLLLWTPQKIGESFQSKDKYDITSMILPLVPMVEEASTKPECASLLDEIDKVLDVDSLLEGARQNKSGISIFWSNENLVREEYTKKDYATFKAAYYKLILKCPTAFFKERTKTFLESQDLLEDTTTLFSSSGNANHEKFRQYPLAMPISKDLRNQVISILELREFGKYDHKLKGYSILYSVQIPLLFLICLGFLLVWKKKWKEACLIGAVCIKGVLVFLTAPSRLFMYYYPIYLVGVAVGGFVLFRAIDQHSLLFERVTDAVAKTLFFLKRNGFKETVDGIMERLDHKNMDELSKKSSKYNYVEPKSKLDKHSDIFFSIIVPAYETSSVHLKDMIESCLQGDYGRFELIIADASASKDVFKVVHSYNDYRLKYYRLSSNKGISDNTNEALKVVTGDYVCLLDHDDMITKNALSVVASMIREHGYQIIYSDEDKCNNDKTKYFAPHFKPDFDLDLLMSNNYICHFLVMKKELIQSLRFRKSYDGAQDYDLILRAVAKLMNYSTLNYEDVSKTQIGHINQVLYHWRCHENSTAQNPKSKMYAYEAGKRALEDFLSSMNINAKVKHSPYLGFYEVHYQEDLFVCRPEVKVIGGRVIEHNRVIASATSELGNTMIGLKASYGGYMHRAKFYWRADSLDERCMIVNDFEYSKNEQESKQKAKKIVLYDPRLVKVISKQKE